MTDLISFPFRLTTAGHVATVEDGTEDCYAEELAVLILTQPGERELVPGYGLTDPTFNNFDPTEVQAKVALFIPQIKVDHVGIRYPSNQQQDIRVEFSIRSGTIEQSIVRSNDLDFEGTFNAIS